MSSPILSLSIAILTAGAVIAVFWPASGLFWKWRRGLHSTQRVLLEDALKHLYDQEYKDLTCTLQSMAGILSLGGDETAKLMARLEGLGMVKAKNQQFELTSEGRKESLRMIRIHRLWERYLADRTGVAETEWHKRAEKLEHNMTEEATEALAASIGNPTYDPHGDPIPTRAGVLPPRKGKALTDLLEGDAGCIIHIEDEPGAVYAQLVAENLHTGMQIRLLDKNPQRLSFIADGEEIVLAPVVAANITVAPMPKELEVAGPRDTLLSLNPGEKGEVTDISKACRGQQRRRLMDLGVVPGTVISVAMRSVAGDPIAYTIRGATIALRKSQAQWIHIKRIEENGNHGTA